MRHRLVTRASFAITVALVSASLAFAWLAGRERAEEPASTHAQGERAFATCCEACHDAGELAERLRASGPGGVATLETFLAGHGGASPAEARAIVEYLREAAFAPREDR